MTRARVAELLEEGLSLTEVARTLALAKSTVCYHARRLGYPVAKKFAARYDWQAIAAYYNGSHSIKECQQRFGFSPSAWSDAIRRGDISPRPRGLALDACLRVGQPVSRGALKRRLIAAGLKPNACERCGTSEWRGRRLSLALHHVNGRGDDNTIENLQLLCPNCHSQTENYGGRNRRVT